MSPIPSDSSVDLLHSMLIAMALCDLRGSTELMIEEMLAGIYLAVGDRISGYWRDPKTLERLARARPEVASAMLKYRSLGKREAVRRLTPADVMKIKMLPPELVSVFRTASEFVSAALRRNLDPPPAVTPEVFLLALINHPELPIAKTLRASGLSIERLQRAGESLTPRPAAPRRLRRRPQRKRQRK
jgi:ClpA/ClpB-like protein